MPKSKKRKKTYTKPGVGPGVGAKPSAGTKPSAGGIQWGGAGTKKTRAFDRYIVPAIVVLVVIGGGLFLWQTLSAGRAFSKLAEGGTAVLDRVQTSRSDGRRHLDPGERQVYAGRYPTSGPHEPIWTRPGFYDSPQPPTRLVHALEHGNVVVYYDRLEPEAEATLKEWADLFTGQWDGVVVTKDPGLGERVVLTAWTNRLDLDSFDAEAAAAFVDAFRGRGPENRVR